MRECCLLETRNNQRSSSGPSAEARLTKYPSTWWNIKYRRHSQAVGTVWRNGTAVVGYCQGGNCCGCIRPTASVLRFVGWGDDRQLGAGSNSPQVGPGPAPKGGIALALETPPANSSRHQRSTAEHSKQGGKEKQRLHNSSDELPFIGTVYSQPNKAAHLDYRNCDYLQLPRRPMENASCSVFTAASGDSDGESSVAGSGPSNTAGSIEVVARGMSGGA